MMDEIKTIIDKISSKTDLDNPENNVCRWYYVDNEGNQYYWIAEYVGKYQESPNTPILKMFRTICNGQVDEDREKIILTYDALIELIIMDIDQPQFEIKQGNFG